MKADVLAVSPVIAAALQIAAGLILLQAAVGKVQRWHEFKGILAAYQLLPHWAVATGATGVVLAEFIAGLALLAAWQTRTMSVVAAGLFVAFAAAMAVNILRGRTSLDCGCFQSARQPLQWRLVFRNLACAAAVLAANGFSLSIDDSLRWVHALPAGAALFAMYIALNAVWALDASRAAAFTRS